METPEPESIEIPENDDMETPEPESMETPAKDDETPEHDTSTDTPIEPVDEEDEKPSLNSVPKPSPSSELIPIDEESDEEIMGETEKELEEPEKDIRSLWLPTSLVSPLQSSLWKFGFCQ